MFIFWGRKIKYKRLGYVADFCPLCRDTRAFKMIRIGSAGHVYYISVGDGELIGHQIECPECKNTYNIDAASYPKIAKKFTTLDALVQETWPSIQDDIKHRFDLEAQLKKDPFALTPAQRLELIQGPFVLLSPKIEAQFANKTLDRNVWFAILATIGLLFLGQWLADLINTRINTEAFWVSLGLGASLTVWQIVGIGQRFLRKHIIPILAKALYPLRPTSEEIKTVLTQLSALDYKIGRKLKVTDLEAELTMLSMVKNSSGETV